MTRQKLPKILAILGGCLLGGGIVLAGAGFVAMGCNLDAYTGGKEAPQPLTASYSPGAVTAVKVDASVGDVAVIGTEAGGDLEVLYSTRYTCQVEDGVLTLTAQEGAGGWKWYRIWNSWEGREDGVTIQVPWDMLLSYDLTTGVGDLRIEDVDAERVAVAGDSGDIRLYSVTGTDFTVTQGVGNTHLENCQGEGLSLSADVGTAQMEDCRFTDAGMEASTGDLLLYTSDFDTLTIDGDVGKYGCPMWPWTGRSPAPPGWGTSRSGWWRARTSAWPPTPGRSTAPSGATRTTTRSPWTARSGALPERPAGPRGEEAPTRHRRGGHRCDFCGRRGRGLRLREKIPRKSEKSR